ncbi:MAG: hypothetical protein LBI73_15710 [Myroides sp.]|jgi:hypothetical protein|nr:hypothetical protein [Myroides sp.]
MSLFDSFPKNVQLQYIKNNFIIGSTILNKIPIFNIEHDKFIIYLADDVKNIDLFGGVIINSIINDYINSNAYLKSQHVLIDVNRHPFLRYDSFVDCTKIHSFSKTEALSYIAKNPVKLCGMVENDIMLEIEQTLKVSTVISSKEKKRYGLI